jgi:hypothetical protein
MARSTKSRKGPKPRYKHQCPDCVFLGSYHCEYDSQWYDLWRHRWEILLAVYGNMDPDHVWMPFTEQCIIATMPPLEEARHRAELQRVELN